MNLQAIFEAGLVRRWHTHPRMSRHTDTLDGHQGRVARLVVALFPGASASLLRAALTHDDGESVTGDMLAPFKARMRLVVAGDPPGLPWACAELEARAALWGDAPKGTVAELDALDLCDRLDALMFAHWHEPAHVRADVEWQEAAAWVRGAAWKLGCAAQVEEWLTRAGF